MAKAAVVELASSTLGRVQSNVKFKRKTPSELRGEQLKRRNVELPVNAQTVPLLFSDRVNLGMTNDPQKPESKVPKYISTRVTEVYPVKKSIERCGLRNGKERLKGPSVLGKASNGIYIPQKDSYGLNNSCVNSNFPPTGVASLSCDKADNLHVSERYDPSAKENGDQGFRKIEKCSQSALRNVVELHLGNEKISDSSKVDMQKALKGLVACDIPPISGSSADSSGKNSDLPSVSSRNFNSEIHIPGQRAPLDFTLKTTLRLVSSSSVKWCHKLSATPAAIGHCSSMLFCNMKQRFDCASGPDADGDTMYTKALHSWVYPQSSLPASIISVMALSAVKGEKDFLAKRQQDWEDSFRNLYYMLRKNMCNIFYVYTTQFIVLFIGGDFSGKKHSCNAYLSQSTRGLRSLLKRHDIQFSMPLCCAEVEQTTEDDLAELSEIEKRNLGQTVQMDSMDEVDNSSQSLLAFIGNAKVHGLYDFLLNYRFFLSSFTAVDVPVLYAPAPFQNASLSVPEVKCREMKRADVVPSSSGSDAEGPGANLGSSAISTCYSIEIKDTVLPPWTVSAICAAMSSGGKSFESSFTTETSSIGLNIALDSICQKSDASTDSLGIPEAIPSLHLRSAALRCLKYSKGSYIAYTTHV